MLETPGNTQTFIKRYIMFEKTFTVIIININKLITIKMFWPLTWASYGAGIKCVFCRRYSGSE